MTVDEKARTRRPRAPRVVPAPTLVPRAEAARLDLDRLEALAARLGPLVAEAEVARTLEELSLRLAEFGALHRSARTADLARRAAALVGPAHAAGLESVARVVGHVADCAARDDWPALAAVLARLERVADSSLVALWDLSDTRG